MDPNVDKLLLKHQVHSILFILGYVYVIYKLEFVGSHFWGYRSVFGVGVLREFFENSSYKISPF